MWTAKAGLQICLNGTSILQHLLLTSMPSVMRTPIYPHRINLSENKEISERFDRAMAASSQAAIPAILQASIAVQWIALPLPPSDFC